MCELSDGRGFTLAEVMVTVVVVLLALSGLLAMQLGTTKANVDSMNHYRALAYAEELIEEIRAAEWRQPCSACCPTEPCAGCPGAPGCDGSDVPRSVPPGGGTAGVGCMNATGGPRVEGSTTVSAVSSLTMSCSFTLGITPDVCDTMATRYAAMGYTDRVRPNTEVGCSPGPPTYPDDQRQACDMPQLVGGVWVGGPPNPTNITFWRCVEMADIVPFGTTSPATLRRVTVYVYWDDRTTLLPAGRGTPHHVTLETERGRQP